MKRKHRATPITQLVISCLALTGLMISFYLEYFAGMQACPLCLMARLFLALVALFSIVGRQLNRSIWIASFLQYSQLLISALGIALSSRQLWLEQQHTKLAICQIPVLHDPDQSILKKITQQLLTGTGDCQAIHTFLKLSLATWTLLIFSVLTLLMLYQIVQRFRAK